MDQSIHVVKIGGSVLCTSDKLFNFEEAQKIKELFLSFQQYSKFILVTGGGYLAREYQKMLKDNSYQDYDQHYAGTMICNLNAVMLRSIFGDLAEEQIMALGDLNADTPITLNKNFLLAGAGHPGPSSDWDAVWLAKRSNAKFVISLKDTDGVYSEDPDKNPNAKHLDNLTWDEYLQIIGNPQTHMPGRNLPVDPIAANLAKESGIKFYIVKGDDFDNLEKVIKGETFTGTLIS